MNDDRIPWVNYPSCFAPSYQLISINGLFLDFTYYNDTIKNCFFDLSFLTTICYANTNEVLKS